MRSGLKTTLFEKLLTAGPSWTSLVLTMLNRTEIAPRTMYQFFLVHRCGHRLLAGPSGISLLVASPDRTEYTPGGIGHIPYADEDAAEDFERAALPVHGPDLAPRATGGFAVYACKACGVHPLYNRGRCDCRSN